MDKKKKREKLKHIHNEAENLVDFKLLFANMLNGFAYCKMIIEKNKPIDFIYLEVNKAFERLTGLKRKHVIGKKVTTVIPTIKEFNPELFDIYGKVARTGKGTTFDMEFKPLNIWLRISAYSPSRGYFAAIFEDITECKNAEKNIEESDERFKLALRGSKITVFNQDKDLRYIWVYNPNSELSPEVVLGKTDEDLVPPEDAEKMMKIKRRVFKSGIPEDNIIRFTVGEKEAFYDLRIEPMYSDDGSIIGIIGVSSDITECKMVEEKAAKTMHDLGERVKELECLYGFSKIVEERNISLDEMFQEIVNIIPPSWQYSDIACARMVFENKVFRTDNFKETKWSQSSDIVVKGKNVGFVEVGYRKKIPEFGKDPFLEEERKVLDVIAGRLGRTIERMRAEEALVKQKETIEQKNIALKEVLEQIELEKQKIKEDVAANAEEVLLPALDKLRVNGASRKHVQVIKENLKEMTSSFGRKISEKRFKLTPREIEICNLIKEGLSTKDIANMQNISIPTIETHRTRIRKKLGITNKKYNLTSYLRDI